MASISVTFTHVHKAVDSAIHYSSKSTRLHHIPRKGEDVVLHMNDGNGYTAEVLSVKHRFADPDSLTQELHSIEIKLCG
jgi:hypothetical protein